MANWLNSVKVGDVVRLMPTGVDMRVETADEQHLHLVSVHRPIDRFMVRRDSGARCLGQLWIESPEPIGIPLDATLGWET